MIPELRPADLILSASSSFISRLIRWFEKRQTGHACVSHAAMALGPLESKPSVVEQLLTMVISPLEKYEAQKILIYRNKKWSVTKKWNICISMLSMMNQPYGFLKIPLNALDCIFRTYWFTSNLGIGHFKECAQAYAWACYRATGKDDVFGCGWRCVTPDIMDDYCREHPEDWELVYKNL
jgi:hypothetical protein